MLKNMKTLNLVSLENSEIKYKISKFPDGQQNIIIFYPNFKQVQIKSRLNNCEDLSLYDDGKHETRRKYLCWGRNFDKDMNRLPKTEWVTIENMSTDHIQAIVDGGWVDNNPYYNSIFKEELKFRENG